MGWVVQQHGEIYWREYGWDARFEALVLKIVSGIVQKWQPAHEKCWIAEVDGVRAGSAFVVRGGWAWAAVLVMNALRLHAARVTKR